MMHKKIISLNTVLVFVILFFGLDHVLFCQEISLSPRIVSSSTESPTPLPASQKSDDNSQSLFGQGKQLYALRKFEDALKIFNAILEQNPSFRLAEIYKRKCENYI